MCVGGGGQHISLFLVVMDGDYFFFFFFAVGRSGVKTQRFRKGYLFLARSKSENRILVVIFLSNPVFG